MEKQNTIETTDETLFREYNKNKTIKLRNQLVNNNQALVTYIVNKYYNYRYIHKKYREDLLQEGTIGLLSAIDGFDIEKGFKFSTYASWWIRQAVNNYIINIEPIIHIPSHVRTAQNKLTSKLKDENKTLQSLIDKQAFDEQETELLSEEHISNKMVSNIRHAVQSRFVQSLDFPISNKNNSDGGIATLKDLIPDDKIETEVMFDNNKILNILNEGIQTLSEKEKLILLLRFDLMDNKQVTVFDKIKKIHDKNGQKKIKR